MSIVFVCFLIVLHFIPLQSTYPFDISYHIDCGAATNSTDRFNITWLSDRFFTGGASGFVSEPLLFSNTQEKTIRYFPSGRKNCYVVPLPAGRYFIRIFTVYDNYDGRNSPPSFDVAIEGNIVFSYRSPWPSDITRNGAYSDVFAFIKDGHADVCFHSIATDTPTIGALEIVQIDPHSYNSISTGDDHLLINYGRLSCGSNHWGPGFTNDTDLFFRSWQSDSGFRFRTSNTIRTELTTESINGTNEAPNYFPEKLYQSGVSGEVEYALTVDAKLDYAVYLHFAEIDPTVKRAGERVFDVTINGKNVSRVDIVKKVGVLTSYVANFTVKNLSSTVLTVNLVPVIGVPLLSGLENYAVVPHGVSTFPGQVDAMRSLKDSLRVPQRMGWNGDPCVPTSWDAWEGITCRLNQDGSALVISQIDLGSQGLRGSVSERISALSNLVALNLSANFLEGHLPPGLGKKPLVRLDLSKNRFTGTIPDSLASSGLQVVLLNDNMLEGRVAEALYAVGVHGGVIDLSGNEGLCGVPSLPPCPLLWGRGSRLSGGAKFGIGVAFAAAAGAVAATVVLWRVRRRRNDYDFDLPKDLMGMSAKRNRYQRQKSLMLLELESQHAKGIPTTLNPP